MGIHHSEFEDMFDYLENEISIPLSEAVEKWNKVKDISSTVIKEWTKILVDKTKDYMDSGYSVGTAMIEVWYKSYDGISDDSDRWYFHISDVRDTFFNESIDELERYEDELIDKADRYPCIKCGWFAEDHAGGRCYCNNFSIERERNSRCVTDSE